MHLRDRLIFQLASVREELVEALAGIENLDAAPAEGMRTYRGQLIEIGGTEASAIASLHGKSLPFSEAEDMIKGDTLEELLASLSAVREETLAYLSGKDDAALRMPIHVPTGTGRYLGGPDLEPEELIRWIIRHEYYHLGQIVSYRWAEGHNPYH
jgi:uncharacterized damage-inducible protein DinB